MTRVNGEYRDVPFPDTMNDCQSFLRSSQSYVFHISKKKKKEKEKERTQWNKVIQLFTDLNFFNWAKIPVSKIYPCIKYNLVVFNIFTNIYNHNHSLIPEYFHHPERKSKQSLPIYPFFSAWQPPTYFLSLWLC